MRQGKHAHTRGSGEPCRAGGRRVSGLVGPRALLLGEGRLVDEDVRVPGDLEDARCGSRVAREDDLAPRPRRPEHLLGANLAPVRELDALARLEAAEERALGHAQRPSGLDVEAAGPRELHERVAVGGHAVSDLERDDAVVPAVDDVAVSELDELDGVAELPEDPLEGAEEVA